MKASTLVLILLVSLSLADQNIGIFNLGLDPAPLKWWQTKWSNNPIDLSVTYKGATSASVTFNISPSTTISSGVLEVTFPSGFDVSTATCSHFSGCTTTISSQLVVLPSVSITAGSDYSFTIGGVTLPTSTGGYGPFALRTRHFADGQTADINLNFGSVGIWKDRSTLTNLTVSLVTSTNNKVGGTGSTLSFKFQIAKDLWKYDIFRITTASQWTVGTSATCFSATYTGRINNFNGTRASDPFNLDCYISAKTAGASQTIYVYGLAKDIDVSASDDNKYVDLRISSVSNPDADYSDSSYSWTVETLRGQTRSIIEYASYSSGPATDPATITSASYAPVWGWSASNIIPQTTIYMNFGFTLVNKIAVTGTNAGSAEIVFTDTLATSYPKTSASKCWLQNYLTITSSGVTTPASCAISSKTATISGLPETAAGTTLTITALVLFDTTSSAGTASASVTTKNKDSVEIDKGSSLGGITLANTTNFYKPTSFKLGYSTGTTYQSGSYGTSLALAGNTANNLSFLFEIDTATEDQDTNTQFTVKFPFVNSSTVSNFEFAIPASSLTWYSKSVSSTTTDFDASTVASTTLTITASSTGSTTSGSSLGSIVFKTNGAVTTGDFYVFGAKSAGATTTNISLPRYATNLATRYEAYLETKDTATTVVKKSQYGAFQIQISPNTFTNGPQVLCLGLMDSQPIKSTFAPLVVDIAAATTGTTFYLELDFESDGTGDDLGSGLSDGNDYPYAMSTNLFTSFTLTKATIPLLKGKLNTSVAVGASTPVVYTAVYSNSGTFTPYQRTYYTIDSDTRNKYITHEKDGTPADIDTVAGTALVTFTSINTTKVLGISKNVTTLSEGYLSLTFDADASSDGLFWVFSYPVGWTIASGATFTIGANSLTTLNITPSSTSTTRFYFKHTSQIAIEAGSFDIAETSITLNVKGPTTAPWVTPTADLIIRVFGSANWDGACKSKNTLVLTANISVNEGTFTAVSISPNSAKGRGPASVNLTETLTFTTANIIPAGGSIAITIDSAWGTTLTKATVSSGLSQVGTTAISAAISSNVLTIGSFAEVAASTAITVIFTGLLPPTFTSSTSAAQTFTASIKSSFTVGGTAYTIDNYTTSVQVTMSAANSTGRSTFTTKTTYPTTASATDVDLYLKFSLANSVPKAGVIELTSPLTFKISSTNTKNQVWLSPIKYSSVTFSSSTLTITLAEDYSAGTTLELFIDKAVDNPTSTTITSSGFTLKTSWASTTIDTDVSQTLQSSQQFTATAALTTTLTASTSNSLTFSPTTASEYATYGFSLKSSVKFASGDQIWIVFPDQFDPLIGYSWIWFTNESTTYYISCSSSQLGTAWCKVDHNIVVVTGTSEVDASTDIAITIMNVKNPAAAKTDAFQILHVSSDGTNKSYNTSFGTVTPTALVYNIEVRSITPADRDLFDNGSYTFVFYLAETFTTTSQIRVMFPTEYSLSLEDKKDSYTCSTTYKDDSDSATNKSEQTWNSNTSCTGSNNWIILPAATTARTFAATDIVTLTVSAVGNPQWAQARTAVTGWDFDATDSDVWTIYDLWTSNFELFVYNTASSSLAYTARSYGVLNRAYLGFTRSRKQLLVNSYNPQNMNNRIVVWAGSQTKDIVISTESTSKPLSAKKVVFTPNTNTRTSDSGKLAYTSEINSFTLWQDEYSINFRVAAKVDLSKGLYYIDWTIDESRQDGLSDNAYNKPVKTLVEVVAKTSKKYKFAVSTIPAVYKGGESAPIKISIDNAPATDVVISLSITGSPAGFSVTPTTMTFKPDVNVGYFQVVVSSTAAFNTTSSGTVALALSGTDADVYSIDATVAFTITDATANAGSITSFGLGTPTRVSVTITPSTDQVGTLYWQLAAKGSNILSFSELSDEVGSVVSTSNSTSSADALDDEIAQEYNDRETDPDDGETWVQFQHRLYKGHVEDYWVGADSVVTTTNSITRSFYWLYGGTKYQVSGYLDNGIATNGTAKVEYFTTVTQADSQPFTIKFQGTVLDSYTSRIAELAAEQQGVNPKRLGSGTRTTSTSRVLQTTTVAYTTFAYTLYSDRSAQDPTPTDQAKIEGTALTKLKTNLKSAGITNEVDSVANSAIPSKTTPTWTSSPDIDDVTESQVSVSLRSSVAGQTCCVAVDEDTSISSPTSEQVFLGLSANNIDSPYSCITTDTTTASNTITVSGLDRATDYNLFCTAVDSFPIWPTHMSWTDDKVTGYSFTTDGEAPEEEDDDSASYLSVALAALVFFN